MQADICYWITVDFVLVDSFVFYVSKIIGG